MAEIIYREEKDIDVETLRNLYDNAGWQAYTGNIDMLYEAVRNSLYVLTAWDKDRLVGLIRVIGDNLTIIYIQDILVLKSCRRKKIGTTLMKTVLEKFNAVRQKVLLTDDNIENRSFYESLGFQSCDNGELVSFVKFEK